MKVYVLIRYCWMVDKEIDVVGVYPSLGAATAATEKFWADTIDRWGEGNKHYFDFYTEEFELETDQ